MYSHVMYDKYDTALRRGRRAERRAARFLRSLGYTILAANQYVRGGELDLIAREGDCLVFVEVKARWSGRFGPPEAALTPSKRRRLRRAAETYLARHPWCGPVRFDVIALRPGQIVLYRNALEAERPCTRTP